MVDGVPSNGWHEAHVEIEVIAGQVKTLDNGLSDLRAQFSTLQRDVASGFTQQATSFTTQMATLSDKIERQGASYAASRNTSISGILVTTAAVAGVMLTLIGAFGYVTIGPIFKFEDDITTQMRRMSDSEVKKEDFRAYATDTGNWIANIRDRLRVDEDNAVGQRQVAELKERLDERYKITQDSVTKLLDKMDGRISAIDTQLVKRPEIESAMKAEVEARDSQGRTLNDRINAITARMNSVQDELHSLFPPSKLIDELWSSLRELRSATTGNIVPPAK